MNLLPAVLLLLAVLPPAPSAESYPCALGDEQPGHLDYAADDALQPPEFKCPDQEPDAWNCCNSECQSGWDWDTQEARGEWLAATDALVDDYNAAVDRAWGRARESERRARSEFNRCLVRSGTPVQTCSETMCAEIAAAEARLSADAADAWRRYSGALDGANLAFWATVRGADESYLACRASCCEDWRK